MSVLLLLLLLQFDKPAELSNSMCSRHESPTIRMCTAGFVGINFEHSGFDGHSFKRIIEELYFIPDGIDTGFDPICAMPPWLDAVPPAQLSFELTEALASKLSAAVAALDCNRDNVDVKVVVTTAISRQWLKDNKVSPDGFIQAAFQIAHRRSQAAGIIIFLV